MKPLWKPSAELITQSCHVGWGCAIVLAAGLHLGLTTAAVGLVVWALVKEYIWDILIEGDSWGGSTNDTLSYLAGGSLGVLTLMLAGFRFGWVF